MVTRLNQHIRETLQEEAERTLFSPVFERERDAEGKVDALLADVAATINIKAQAIYNAEAGITKSDIETLEKFHLLKSVRFEVSVDVNGRINDGDAVEYLRVRPEFYMPSMAYEEQGRAISATRDAVFRLEDEKFTKRLAKQMQAAWAARKEREAITEERIALAAAIDKLIKNSRTLEQVVEHWPQAARFMPLIDGSVPSGILTKEETSVFSKAVASHLKTVALPAPSKKAA